MTFGLGVAAALAGPLVMTIGFIAWQNHWKGSAFALNLFKCNLASLGFLVLACTTRSRPFPSDVFTLQTVGYMFLSSTIGIIIGDWTWLEALQLLGARRVILMDSLKPFLAAFFGWLLLDEDLRPAAFGGMVLTMAGVLLVSLETTSDGGDKDGDGDKNDGDDDTGGQNVSDEAPEIMMDPIQCQSTESEKPIQRSESTSELSVEEKIGNEIDSNDEGRKKAYSRDLRLGYPYAILNVLLDTYGAVLIKQHGKLYKVWEINLLRFGFAGAVMLLVSLGMFAMRRSRLDSEQTRQIQWYSLPTSKMTWSSWGHVSVGVLLVTFATPSLSNYALFQIALALALTLGSIGPLYSLPLTYLMQHDAPTIRTAIGAFLAVAGVVVLTWKGTLPEDE
mmetsp:Transcript_9537/g.18341  ORF Transcript_9537/g.18341 Transcript_9537/m.18341 type:complete len:391 (-) Transcript_9537:496-1668(-)